MDILKRIDHAQQFCKFYADGLYSVETEKWKHHVTPKFIEDIRQYIESLQLKLMHVQTQQQAEPVAWTPVAEALPKSGEKVLACYRHRWFNLRPIRAFWTAAKTEEADSDDARRDYDEATDAYYVPEGWYECIDNWDDYSSVAVTEGAVTHWMPLPQPPLEAAHGIKEQP